VSSQPTDLDSALDRLYAAPFESFTETRDALAKEVKAAGNAELAAQLRKERRPPVTVWALNQAARRHPEPVRALLESGERLRDAQERAVRGEGAGPLRDATAEQRQALASLLKDALAIVREAGSTGSTDQQDRMEGTLLACANGPRELGRQLAAGKLEKDLPRPGFGDLGGLAAGAAAAAPRAAPPPPLALVKEKGGDEEAEATAREQREQERKQRELDRLRKEAEHRAQDAARALAEAQRRRGRAEESARRAATALEEATADAQRAREALAAAEQAVTDAESEQRAADQALAMLR